MSTLRPVEGLHRAGPLGRQRSGTLTEMQGGKGGQREGRAHSGW